MRSRMIKQVPVGLLIAFLVLGSGASYVLGQELRHVSLAGLTSVPGGLGAAVSGALGRQIVEAPAPAISVPTHTSTTITRPTTSPHVRSTATSSTPAVVETSASQSTPPPAEQSVRQPPKGERDEWHGNGHGNPSPRGGPHAQNDTPSSHGTGNGNGKQNTRPAPTGNPGHAAQGGGQGPAKNGKHHD